MRKRNYFMAVLACLPMVQMQAFSQTSGGDTLRVSWEDVADRVDGNPEVLRQRLEIARARTERLRATFFPSLPEFEYTLETDAPFHNNGEGGWEIGLSQEIEIGGQYFLRRRIADEMVAQAEFETRAVELEIRAEVRRAFAQLLAAESQIRLLDTLVQFARRLDTVAGRLLAAEEISELDRNTVHIERGRAEIERLAAQSAVFGARAELGRLLGVSGSTVVTVSNSMSIPTAGLEHTLDSVVIVESALAAGDERLLERRPDWQALERAKERLRVERNLAGRQWLPTPRIGLSLSRETAILSGEDITGGSEAVRSGFGTLRSEDNLLGIHLTVGIPLPFGGLYDLGQGEIAVAEAELALIDAEQRILASRIRADVAGAAARLRNTTAAFTLYSREIAPLVSRNLELLERGYRAGELSATELVTQQEQAMRAGEALIEAQREYNEALADFERATAQ